MNFDWSEYLKLAQELAGQVIKPASKEAKLRSSISRAYYAAFCKARNYLRDAERLSIPSGPEAHTDVRDTFLNSPNKSRRKIGESLKRLRTRRNKVDYEDSVTGLSSKVKASLRDASFVVSALN